MEKPSSHFGYRLGIDVGVASLGLAILKLEVGKGPNAGEPDFQIFGGSVRTYPIPEGAAERRGTRSMRRNIERRNRRLDRISDLLSDNGIGPRRGNMPKALLDLSPIKMRAMASRERVDLAHFWRALMHMARHRGSSAFRESTIAEEDKEARQTATAIKSLRTEMAAKGFQTYGQYLRWREKNNLPIRINQEKQAASKGGYAYYPSREMLQEEFEAIWAKQAEFYKEVLGDALKKRVYAELFFQRTVTTPPPGKCPYNLDQARLSRASRLFQQRRVYEEANNLRFSRRNGNSVHYGLAERDRIVERLMAGDDLTFAEIKKTIGLGRNDKVSLENTKTRDGIKGYPFDRDLGRADILGVQWKNAAEEQQDAILDVLATIHDDEKAITALSDILGGDREAAKRVLQAPLPTGWGHMGLTATTKILEELKQDVVPARIAEERAGLSHVMAPDGQVYDRLPYYGEILAGHTVDPMWVSDYRLDSDRPPHTDAMEIKYGRIPNPVVHLALRQIQKAVNAVIKKYGLPEAIHIEVARDLNKSAEARDEVAKNNARNKRDSDHARSEILGIGIEPNRLRIQKYKLWRQQGGVCVYSGECIPLSALYSGGADIDHILPRSKTYSDAMSNKIVCTPQTNAHKSNRPPYEAFHDHPDYDWDAIMRRVDALNDNAKAWRFTAVAMEQFEDQEGFRARYGTDNAYIARVTRQYLTCLYGEQHKVVAVSSHIVGLLRGKWGLQNILGSKEDGKKARDDHRHHFIDALVTACATRGMIQRIQREAARCEYEKLEDFVKTIAPPFGVAKGFYNAAREAALERVSLSRKVDHSTAGQLHEDTFIGIIDGPDKNGFYISRLGKKVDNYNNMSAMEKPKIKNTMPNLPGIIQARQDLDDIKQSLRDLCVQARIDLEAKQRADITAGKKGAKISDNAVFSRAVELHKSRGGKTTFALFENRKLVNIRRAQDGNRPTGGYISGRNHRKDFYLDTGGMLQWQLVSMLEANDKNFVPSAKQLGHQLLWSAHKEDILLMDDPDNPDRRIRVVVAKIKEDKMGVVPETDARDAKERIMWEKGLKFFAEKRAQRIVTDVVGDTRYYFPALPRSGKS